MAHRLFWLFFVLAGCARPSRTETNREVLQKLLYNITAYPMYDASFRPLQPNVTDAVMVEVDAVMVSIGPVNAMDMSWTVSLYFRQEWQDPRLVLKGADATHRISIGYQHVERIWRPDVYFSNSQVDRTHDVTVPNQYLTVNVSTGRVLFSQRLTVTLDCEMDLRNFPHDSQSCDMNVESYGYTTRDLKLTWSSSRSATNLLASAFIPDFTITDMSTSDCTAIYATGTFPCLRSTVKFHREIGFYITETYIPTVLIVILSWASFWIDHEAVPARISVGLLTVLTITTQLSGSRAQLPRVSYIKAIDVWMSTNLVFVFAAYMEYAVVTVLSRRYKKKVFAHRTWSTMALRVREQQQPGQSSSSLASIVQQATTRLSQNAEPEQQKKPYEQLDATTGQQNAAQGPRTSFRGQGNGIQEGQQTTSSGQQNATEQQQTTFQEEQPALQQGQHTTFQEQQNTTQQGPNTPFQKQRNTSQGHQNATQQEQEQEQQTTFHGQQNATQGQQNATQEEQHATFHEQQDATHGQQNATQREQQTTFHGQQNATHGQQNATQLEQQTTFHGQQNATQGHQNATQQEQQTTFHGQQNATQGPGNAIQGPQNGGREKADDPEKANGGPTTRRRIGNGTTDNTSFPHPGSNSGAGKRLFSSPFGKAQTKPSSSSSCRKKSLPSASPGEPPALDSRDTGRRVDKFSRFLFPFCFIVFNAIYWTYYLRLAH